MNIDDLIHDLRARINPQYFDQPGTESYERHHVVMALEQLRVRNDFLHEKHERLHAEIIRLREENERLRKDAEVGAAIERAARDLPVGDMIEITVENGSAVTVIYYGIGGWDTMDVDNGNRLADEINAAIDAARGGK